MSYDSKVYELAEFFLEDSENARLVREKHKEQLAQIIQDRIEDYINDGDNFALAPRDDNGNDWRHEAIVQMRLK